MQVDEYKKSDAIFNSEYVYFSSYSTSWLGHSRKYTQLMKERFGLGESSLVVEIASNDGYLLQYFKEQNIPVLGIEPTANTAKVAIGEGHRHPRRRLFWRTPRRKPCCQGKKGGFCCSGNNVLAHVPDIVDFVGGLPLPA